MFLLLLLFVCILCSLEFWLLDCVIVIISLHVIPGNASIFYEICFTSSQNWNMRFILDFYHAVIMIHCLEYFMFIVNSDSLFCFLSVVKLGAWSLFFQPSDQNWKEYHKPHSLCVCCSFLVLYLCDHDCLCLRKKEACPSRNRKK